MGAISSHHVRRCSGPCKHYTEYSVISKKKKRPLLRIAKSLAGVGLTQA